MDRFSPFAPAYIRVLVLPVGRIARVQFLDFVTRLQDRASILPLSNLTPQPGDADVLLAPPASSKGLLSYNYTTSVPSEQQQQLSPFELFREPLLVLGVVDGLDDQDGGRYDELGAASEYLRERHPRVVDRQLVILGRPGDNFKQAANNIVSVDRIAIGQDTSLQEALCKISARFLRELSTYTTALQASPSIQTPGQTARSLQRTISQRESERRPGSASGRSTPSQSNDTTSPVDESGSRPPPWSRGSPATSFDQIPNASGVAGSVARSDSRTSNRGKHGPRASSQDRVSVQGFGSNTSQDKLKQRGKARVGIVIGSIYMMAGHWSEALHVLTEHANKARILADHIWHAKGLENIVVCLLLHCWVGLEFQIPSICYPLDGRASQRFSVNLPSDFRTTDAALQVSLRNLSNTLPDLLKLILSLYRSGEGSLELPFDLIAESTIRFGKLLAILRLSNGELNSDILDRFIGRTRQHSLPSKFSTPSIGNQSLSKGSIAAMLAHAQPPNSEGVPEGDQIAILAGIAAVYALLGMDRKKGIVLRELLTKLTTALTPTGKRGAAEMGLHSAAGLTSEAGSAAVFASNHDSNGMNGLINELARIYGIELIDDQDDEASDRPYRSFFGGEDQKLTILKELASYCEASPELAGILRVNTSMLRSVGPNGAIDTEASSSVSVLSKDEQAKLPKSMHRAIGLSRNLGQPKIEATYWDPFLVRGIEFVPPEPNRAIVKLSKLQSAAAIAEAASTSTNPLLYDPSASRPGTAEQPTSFTLVEGESNQCIVTLQNPYDLPVDFESLRFIAEGVQLETRFEKLTLGPMRLQRVSITLTASTTGESKITGCRIKIGGCSERSFPIISKPWMPAAPTLIKDIGQEGRATPQTLHEGQEMNVPERALVPALVVGAQPLLALEDSPFSESSLMLLEGEEQVLRVTLKNISDIPATLFNIVGADVHALPRPKPEQSNSDSPRPVAILTAPVVVAPRSTVPVEVTMLGRPGLTHARLAFHYSRGGDEDGYARILTLPIDITVNASLNIRNAELLANAKDENSETCLLSFDLGNAWPNPLSYSCDVLESRDSESSTTPLVSEGGVLAAGATHRIHLPIPLLPPTHAADNLESIRKAITDRLRITWHVENRSGHLDTTNIALSKEALTTAVAPRLGLTLQVVDTARPASSEDCIVESGTFITLRATLANRAADTGEALLVRLHTRASDSAGTATTAEDRRIVSVGQTSRLLAPLKPGEDAAVNFVMCPMLAGEVEVVVSAEPAFNGQELGRSQGIARVMRLNIV